MNRVPTPGREPRRRWIFVLVASVVAHVLVLSSLSAKPGAASVPELSAIDLTFDVVEVPSPAVVEPVSPELPLPKNRAPVATTEAARRPRAPASFDRPTAPEPAAPEPTAPEPAEATPRPDLDPASVARAFVLFEQSAPSDASAGEGEGRPATEPEKPNYLGGLGEKQHLSRREAPKLQRHRDGTYRYRGRAFKAIVEKDGSVVFDDGYRQGSTVRFDLTDAMMRRRGEDPYRVEKKWFLEGTAAFREELLERWRAKQTLLSLQKLRRHLLHISEDTMLSDHQKSARVIAMYRDTTDDEAGAAARNEIAEFVADRMPTTELPDISR